MSKRIAMIFPGQGSQSVGMGQSFYENSEVAREMFDKAGARIGVDFKALLFEENEQINQTAYTQPAILLVSLIAYRLFQDACNVTPTLLLGHSLGEFSAVSAAGALDYLDAVELVHKRGALMQAACDGIDAGMMAIVGLDDASVEKLCADAQAEGKKVWPANYNQDGPKRALLLNMSVSSHCPLLENAQAPLKEAMEGMLSESFAAPVVSNVTAAPYSTKSEAVALLTDQLVKPVRYKQSIEAIAGDVDMAIEFGNGAVLKGLNRRIAKDMATLNVSDFETLQKVIEELS